MEKQLIKIDIHCHTTNRLLENSANPDATIEQISYLMNKFNINTTCLLATYFPFKGTGISNYRLLSWINEREEFLLFGSLDFQNYFYQGLNELEELGKLRFPRSLAGIKVYTSYQNINLHSNEMNRLARLATDLSVPLMFHAGYSYSSMKTIGKMSYTQVVKASNLEHIARNYPELPIIISHLSKPFLKDLIKVVKRNDNVYSDMSGLIDSYSDHNEIPKCIDDIKQYLNECGPERLLFGTDFPVQTHSDSVYMIEEAMRGFSLKKKYKVYYLNSKNLLKLKSRGRSMYNG